MVVVALVGILAAMSVQGAGAYTARSKRVEAVIVLAAVHDAQQAYRADHDAYAATFDELGLSVDGATRLNATQIRAKSYTYSLSRPWGEFSFYCSAVGNLDSDEWPDVVIVEDGSPMRW
jgi:type II secretory pathway pseudopilin PulG